MSQGDQSVMTTSTRLSHPKAYEVLDIVLSSFASLRHKLWRDLVIKETPVNELKKRYIREYGITARHFNSLVFAVTALKKSREELEKEEKKNLAGMIKSRKAKIAATEAAIDAALLDIKAINTYREKKKKWREEGGRKPKLLPSLRKKQIDQLYQSIEQNRHVLHGKKRNLARLEGKLQALSLPHKPSVCFGTKKLFNTQHHLDAAGIPSREAWLKEFREARASQVLFVGSSDESFANQTLQYNPVTKQVKLRLPTAPKFEQYGKYLVLEGIEFPEHLRSELHAAIGAPTEGTSKSRKSNAPVTYRLVRNRKVNDTLKQHAYYLQASFNVPKVPVTAKIERGALGIDLNADHIAVAETDHCGNLKDSFVIPFDFKGKSSDQVKALIGDMVAVVADRALDQGKAIVVESLDFAAKKRRLRELPKSRRTFLSAFAYSSFFTAVESRTRSHGVELIDVNPCYTSLIGAYKYQHLPVSSHEKAALAIARRGQHFSEAPKVHQVTSQVQAMILESDPTKDQATEHVWGFYQYNSQCIRSLLILPDRRSHLPVRNALFLAQGHPSLAQSLTVTLKERLGDDLCRSSA